MRGLVLFTALALTGCYKNTYTTGLPQGNTQTVKATFYLYGLVGEKTVDLSQLCPNDVAWFQNRMEVPDAIVNCITCSIVNRITIEVRCASGSAWLTVPDEQQMLTWVYPIDDAGNPVETDNPPVLFNGNTVNQDLTTDGGIL